MPDGAEREEEQQEDERQGSGHRHRKPLICLLQVLKLPAVRYKIPNRQLQLPVYLLLHFLHHTGNVAAPHVEAHDDAPLGILALYLVWPLPVLDVGHLLQGYLHSAGCSDVELSDIGYVLPLFLQEAHHQVKTAVSLVHHPGALPGKGRVEGLVHRLHVQPELGYLTTVDVYHDLRQARDLLQV